jgi:hypothetical protein
MWQRMFSVPVMHTVWRREPDSVMNVLCCKEEVSAKGLISCLEDSYRLWCIVVCDLKTCGMRRPWPTKLNLNWSSTTHICIISLWLIDSKDTASNPGRFQSC